MAQSRFFDVPLRVQQINNVPEHISALDPHFDLQVGAQVKQKAGLFLQQLKLMKKHQEHTYNVLVSPEIDQQVCQAESVDIHFDETAPNRISALQRMLLFPEQDMAEEPQIVEPRQFKKQNNCVIQLDSSLSSQSCGCCLNY